MYSALAGKYKGVTGSSACISSKSVTGSSACISSTGCPSYSMMLAGAISATRCTCNAAYSRDSTDGIAPCSGCIGGGGAPFYQGSYSDVAGSTACKDCPTNLPPGEPVNGYNNLMMSSGGEYGSACYCNWNSYFRINLTNVPLSSYSTFVYGPGQMGNPDPIATANPALCVPFCSAGKIHIDTLGNCENCPSGKYKGYDYGANSLLRTCVSCGTPYYGTTLPMFTTPGATSSTQCRCDWGFYQFHEYGCLVCPPNTNSSAQHVTSIDYCGCNPGYWGPSNGCIACAAGKYKSWTCVREYTYLNCNSADNCWSCPNGKYSSVAASSACTDCPRFSTSPYESSSITSCICNSGYEKVAINSFNFTCEPLSCAAGSTGPAGSCAQCVPGKYKAVTGSAACDDCLAGKYSAVTGSSTSSTCQNCSVGTYSATPGSSACTLCPSGKYSAATGASTSTTCQCAAGATG